MGKLAERIKERSRNVQPRKVEVPELGDGGEPLIVYMHPLTLKERSEVLPLAIKNDMSAVALSVRLSARDEDGKYVFDLEDERMMVNSKDNAWIIRLGEIVNTDLVIGVDLLGENSRLEEQTTS